MTSTTIGTARRWSMLVVALTATLFANVFINGVAFLIRSLHCELGLDLGAAGLMSSLPSFGMVVTLIGWGWVVDRFGERIVLTVGSALTAAAAFAAAAADSLLPSASSCSSAEWPRQVVTRRAAAWSSAGFRHTGAASRWASGRPRSRWESAWPRW